MQFARMDKQGSMKAKQLAKEAIALDANYATPYSTLSSSHLLDLWFEFRPEESPKESMRLAVEAAGKGAGPRSFRSPNSLWMGQFIRHAARI